MWWVLSSAKMGTSSWRYYTNAVACRVTEYYLGEGEAPGRWHGRGLEALGLTPGARVGEQQLEALLARGLHPGTGERLGRAWRTDGVTGFDLTFSAPKSVSALWALGSAETAAEAVAAHQAAVAAGLAYLDTHAAVSRRGTDGTEQIATAGFAAALFEHRTSRAGDPQLHTHALVVNKLLCTDGVWRTLDATELFHYKKTAGMIYQAALRSEMHNRLGVTFTEVNEHGQADIVGVPEELLELWSKRTAAITAEAAPKIAEYETDLDRDLSAKERAIVVKTAVLKTRPGKTHPVGSTLHATWAIEAARTGWTPTRLLKAVTHPTRRPGAGPRFGVPGRELPGRWSPAPEWQAAADAAELALAGLRAAGQRRAVFSRADVTGQLAALLPTSGLSAEQVRARLEELTTLAPSLSEAVPVGAPTRGGTERGSDPRYATVEVMTAEARILTLAEATDDCRVGHVPDVTLQPEPARTGAEGGSAASMSVLAGGRVVAVGPDEGQAGAVARLTGRGEGLSVLTAPAGAGKTATLGAAAAVWQQAGYRVVGLAPSARAAGELAEATGGRTDTLAKWLHTHRHPDRTTAADRAWAGLDDRTVVIVDEASMASTLDLDLLTSQAAGVGCKVVLVGDPAQIGVINGPGGLLAALARTGRGIELEQVHRFTHTWERQASLRLRDGVGDVARSGHAGPADCGGDQRRAGRRPHGPGLSPRGCRDHRPPRRSGRRDHHCGCPQSRRGSTGRVPRRPAAPAAGAAPAGGASAYRG